MQRQRLRTAATEEDDCGEGGQKHKESVRESQKREKWGIFGAKRGRRRREREKEDRERTAQKKWKGRKGTTTRGRYIRAIARTFCPRYSPDVLAFAHTTPFKLKARQSFLKPPTLQRGQKQGLLSSLQGFEFFPHLTPNFGC